MAAMPTRTVVIAAFPGIQSLDVTGPLEVFHGAARVVPDAYDVVVATLDGAPVPATSGITIGGGVALGEVGGIDTLLVPGGGGSRSAVADRRLVGWLRERAPSARRVASVCTGAFLLAEAGLLDGRRVSTHWGASDELARAYPSVLVDPEPIFTRDGNVWTSAGVSAGMDLALALVEEDLGRDSALAIARQLVMFLRRPGNQTQFSAQLSAQVAHRAPLREVQQWITEHPEADLSVDTLARRAGLSPRQFARAFADEAGVSPGRYVDQVRLEAARRQLEDTGADVGQVARVCGYGTPESMRRAFLRSLGVSPAEYRRRFAAARI
jgi:transcriptional regulator GlxA family with amidase domain